MQFQKGYHKLSNDAKQAVIKLLAVMMTGKKDEELTQEDLDLAEKEIKKGKVTGNICFVKDGEVNCHDDGNEQE